MRKDNNWVWMSGITCLGCGKWFYDGYDRPKNSTLPCLKCGSVAPIRMRTQAFRKAVEERDERLKGNEND